MEDPDEIQFLTEFSKYVNDMVDSLAVALEKAAKEDNRLEHFEIKEEWKSEVKYITKQLVPHKHPMTSFMLVITLTTLLMGAFQAHLMAEGVDLDELSSSLRDQLSDHGAIDMLNERQARNAEKYKDMEINHKTMKVADLGDVTEGISYN